MLLLPSVAAAGLKDVGPIDPTTGFPLWYRDTSATALSLCTEQRPSPNANAGGAPMCFPVVPDPAGYAGNLGGEIFYFNASASLAGANGFSMLWEGAIEATYATGTPIRGDEITFARIRIVMDTQANGTYTVTHPYGVEVFPNVRAGKRSVFYTIDIGVAPGVFTGALAGAVGPFLEWATDAANPTAPLGVDPVSGTPYTLAIANPDGSAVQFLGDPNFFHAVQGSPFGTNYVRVDGPPGSNLDGAGNDFIVVNQFAVVGQRHTIPIAQPLTLYRANYSVDERTGKTSVDVYTESNPGVQLIATADGVPTMELSVDPLSGEGYSHAEFTAAAPIGSVATVTNVSDTPHSAVTAPLTDIIDTTQAVLFPDVTGATGGTISISATSSVHTNPAPLLSVLELPLATWSQDPATPWVQSLSYALPVGATPPWHLTVQSTAGGSRAEPVVIGATQIDAPVGPTALPLSATTPEDTLVNVAVFDPLTSNVQLMVLNPPANGTATANLDGTISYTPRPLFNGVDSFTYLLYTVDPLDPLNTKKWVYSNAAPVSVTVTITNSPPVAVADLVTTPVGTAVTFNATSNDTDVDGTVQPTSATIVTPPVSGTVVKNLDGTFTYTPAGGFVGVVTFTYTVTDDLGAVSAPGTVSVTVTQNEQITVTQADWIVSKGRWRISGTSSVFGPGVANTVSVYIGRVGALGKRIGTPVAIGATGAWTMDVIDPTLTLDATGAVTAISTGGGSNFRLVARK